MGIEVKVLVPGSNWDQLRQLIPVEDDHKKREIWFFEIVVGGTTLLKERELILRARVNRNRGKADTTAKLRRFIPTYPSILKAWEQLDGFKSEIDAGGESSAAAPAEDPGVPAWSLTVDANECADLYKLNEHNPAVEAIFTRHQQVLLQSAWPQLPWKELKPLGPIESVKWDGQYDLNIEKWSIGEETLFEVSMRGDTLDEPSLAAEIRRHLQAVGIQSSGNVEGKTAWALKRLVQSSHS
jgi:hypothetical protein